MGPGSSPERPKYKKLDDGLKYLADGGYMSTWGIRGEFQKLYKEAKLKGSPLFREANDFYPNLTLTLQEIIEEDEATYWKRILACPF